MPDSFAVLQAFAAGVLSFFAPCSVAMLPAYISYYLRREGEEEPTRPDARAVLLLALALALLAGALVEYDQVNNGFARLSALPVALLLGGLACAGGSAWLAQRGGMARPLLLGGLTALGILAVFALLGLPFVALAHALSFEQLSDLVLAMAALLVLLGLLGLAGKDLGFALPVRAPRRRTPLGFLLFGVAYGIVSMGCTLPLFLLGAVGPLLRSSDAATALLGALAYGMGMAGVMLITTFSLAVGRGLTQQRLRGAVPWMKRASNVVLVLAGSYIAWYDWTVLRLTG
jgi:cytochrome c biogenesis protein CcdA